MCLAVLEHGRDGRNRCARAHQQLRRRRRFHQRRGERVREREGSTRDDADPRLQMYPGDGVVGNSDGTVDGTSVLSVSMSSHSSVVVSGRARALDVPPTVAGGGRR